MISGHLHVQFYLWQLTGRLNSHIFVLSSPKCVSGSLGEPQSKFRSKFRPGPKERGAMRSFRNRPGAAGTMAPGDVLTTHRCQEELLTLHLLKEHSHKGNYINILICLNRTTSVLLRRKKLLL